MTIDGEGNELEGATSAAVAIAAATALVVMGGATAGCIGGRYDAKTPTAILDAPTQAVIDGINTARAAAQLPPATWVPELRPPAARAGLAVARGDQSMKSAAQLAAQGGVSELGRHVWSFGAVCTDIRQFRPPAMAIQHSSLLFSAAAVSGTAGQTFVFLLIAEPGASSIRPEQMGGGRGGSNPTFETYVHPSVATGPCGETWPAAPRARL